MSETLTIHPPHAWILGLAPDEPLVAARQPDDGHAGDAAPAPVEAERRDGAGQPGDAR